MERRHTTVKIILSTKDTPQPQNFSTNWNTAGTSPNERDVYVVFISLIDQPIVQSISHIFLLAKKDLYLLRDGTFFVHSLEFFVKSFLKIGHTLISRLDKKIKRVDKKWINWTIGRPRDQLKAHGCPWQLYNCFIVANQRGWRGGTLQSKEVWVQRIAWHPDLVNNSTAK